MPTSNASPFARLVLMIACLSIAGSILAGAHYYAVDLPTQKTVTEPPQNCAYMECVYACIKQYNGQNMDWVLQCGNGCSGQSTEGCPR